MRWISSFVTRPPKAWRTRQVQPSPHGRQNFPSSWLNHVKSQLVHRFNHHVWRLKSPCFLVKSTTISCWFSQHCHPKVAEVSYNTVASNGPWTWAVKLLTSAREVDWVCGVGEKWDSSYGIFPLGLMISQVISHIFAWWRQWRPCLYGWNSHFSWLPSGNLT